MDLKQMTRKEFLVRTLSAMGSAVAAANCGSSNRNGSGAGGATGSGGTGSGGTGSGGTGSGGAGGDRSSPDGGDDNDKLRHSTAPPQFWYDADNVDGLNNATIVDGQAVATWVNLGTFGSGGNLSQASTASRPLFHSVATPGQINGKSAIEGDGSRWLASPAFTPQPQPCLIVMVYRMTDVAAPYVLCAGSSDGQQYEMYLPAGGSISVVAGGAFTPTSHRATPATWETSLTMLAGASSWDRLNGSQSGSLGLGPVGFSGVTLFGENNGFRAKAMIAEHIRWVGTLPEASDVEAYLTTRRGYAA